MYRVIIIDDEDIVRRGIRTLIKWENTGFEICGEGKDGREGLQKILEYKPELVLIDIKMPGINGIEVIKQAKEQGYRGQFIILTGYSEFDYAKSAVSLGVKEYLLKPINENKLLDIVIGIGEELKQREGMISYHKGIEEKARAELLRQILHSSGEHSKIEEKIALYHMDVSYQSYCVAVIKDKDIGTEKFNSCNIDRVNELLIGNNYHIEKLIMDEWIVLVGFGADFMKWTVELSKSNERVNRKFGNGFMIALGQNVTKWYDICYSYELARYLMENKFLYNNQQILTIETIYNQNEPGEEISIEDLEMLVEIGDLERLKSSINHFRNYCRNNLLQESEIKLQIIASYVLLIKQLGEKYGLEKNDLLDGDSLLKQMTFIKELDELMNIYYHMLCQLSRQSRGVDTDSIIKRVHYYMENNYNKDLKLEKIGKLFNYNSAYLGQLFIKEKGENFNNTLDAIRITNAKRLLSDTDMKVYQISEAVGYKNIDLFYQKFKKYVGITPKEYIKSIMK